MMKNLLSSMTGRVFLILVGGSIFSASIVMAFAEHYRQELTIQFKAQQAADHIHQVLLILNSFPPSSRIAYSEIAEKSGVRIGFSNTASPASDHQATAFLVNFNNAIKQVLGLDSAFKTEEHRGDYCPSHFSEYGHAAEVKHCATVLTTLNDGTLVKIDVALRDGGPPLFHGDFLFTATFFLITIALLSLIVARIASQPLRELASAAKRLGNNIEQPALFTTKGPTEVREASIAFNTMQKSIRNHIEERTFMLAGVVHDLQTPLTRLRLRLEKIADIDLKNGLVDDLADAQEIISQGIVYAQLMSLDDPFETVDLDVLITAIYQDAIDAGSDVTLTGKVGKPVLASPHAIRRCISNLVENALKYGGYAHIHASREHCKAIITITDGGPGIPNDQLENVLHPFKRSENSSARNSRTTGLGLTIARIIANHYQGSISLKNIKAGGLGLVVTLELPGLDNQ
ncbi:MAG TPA: ATP-binding protein [Methylophilaceae bacterium]|jgi:signal transduction histidine kinase